jgi:hypothetical protein
MVIEFKKPGATSAMEHCGKQLEAKGRRSDE